MVISKFSGILDKNVEKPYWEQHPFVDEGLMKLVQMVPVMDIESATIRFVYPDDLDYYKSDVSLVFRDLDECCFKKLVF